MHLYNCMLLLAVKWGYIGEFGGHTRLVMVTEKFQGERQDLLKLFLTQCPLIVFNPAQ